MFHLSLLSLFLVHLFMLNPLLVESTFVFNPFIIYFDHPISPFVYHSALVVRLWEDPVSEFTSQFHSVLAEQEEQQVNLLLKDTLWSLED